jgi:hypothetical protein
MRSLDDPVHVSLKVKVPMSNAVHIRRQGKPLDNTTCNKLRIVVAVSLTVV